MAQTGSGLKRLVQYAPGWQVAGTPKRDPQAVLDEIIRRYIASYNDRNIDGMLACVTDDVVFENISNAGQSMRLDGKVMMRQVAEASGTAFSYRRQRLTNRVTGASTAAAEIELLKPSAIDGFDRPPETPTTPVLKAASVIPPSAVLPTPVMAASPA